MLILFKFTLYTTFQQKINIITNITSQSETKCLIDYSKAYKAHKAYKAYKAYSRPPILCLFHSTTVERLTSDSSGTRTPSRFSEPTRHLANVQSLTSIQTFDL